MAWGIENYDLEVSVTVNVVNDDDEKSVLLSIETKTAGGKIDGLESGDEAQGKPNEFPGTECNGDDETSHVDGNGTAYQSRVLLWKHSDFPW